MRKTVDTVTAAAAAAAIALLSACSNGSRGTGEAIPSNATRSGLIDEVARSGIAPKFYSVLRLDLGRAAAVPPNRKSKKKGDLFVSDIGTGAVEILKNKTWTNVGSIGSGVDGPAGAWVDTKGNFYVANYNGVNIKEYAPGRSTPKYTYSDNMYDPTNVTTDSKGNVYEGDYLGGYVGEYAQGQNAQIAQCSLTGWVSGVAIDESGDVFVAYFNTDTNAGHIEEYTGGLSGCNATTLGVSLVDPVSMVLDKKGDLVVVDELADSVDIIAPPYDSITTTLGSGYSIPFHVTVNKKNDQAYVDNLFFYGGGDVLVLSYPGGSTEATLGSSNGLETPFAAVDGHNYNP